LAKAGAARLLRLGKPQAGRCEGCRAERINEGYRSEGGPIIGESGGFLQLQLALPILGQTPGG